MQITKAAVQLGLIGAIVALVLTSNGEWAIFFAVIFVLSAL